MTPVPINVDVRTEVQSSTRGHIWRALILIARCSKPSWIWRPAHPPHRTVNRGGGRSTMQACIYTRTGVAPSPIPAPAGATS